jgi:hypothetical protein
MFVIKGVALGAVMFFLFSLIYLWAYGMVPTASRAIGITGLKALTVQNTLYWTVAVLMLILGCVIVRMWPVKVS